MAKTFYPGLLKKLEDTNKYVTRRRRTMSKRLQLDSAHIADLDTLQAALLLFQNTANWPDYREGA
jgi:hypothetical protein